MRYLGALAAVGARTARLFGLWLLLWLLCSGPSAWAQEVATVQLEGQALFPVVSVEGETAAQRARRIEQRLRERLATDEPLAPVRVVPAGELALLLVGQDTMARVTPRDAEVAAARPLEPRAIPAATRQLGEQWATALRQAFARIAEAERARVAIEGITFFEVGGTPELRAARRAAAIQVRLSELAAAPDEPPPIRAARPGGGAVVLAGTDVLIEVTAADAAAHDLPPLELATEWAAQLERGIGFVRQQRSWRYILPAVGMAVAGVLLAALLHWGMRRSSRRLRAAAAERAAAGEGWGVFSVVARWVLNLLQLTVWTLLGLFILWLIPRTRSLTFTALERMVEGIAASLTWLLLGEGLIVVLILAMTIFAARFLGALVHQVVVAFGTRQGGRASLRAGTLAGTASGGAKLVIFFIGLLALLAQLEVEILPLLAGFGVAGIAIGFGVQSLIRDFFTGFFILLEDQYGVGDVIKVRDITGKVERFTLRITQVRSMDGSLTSIPNGEITTVTNLSKDWAQAVLDVHIALGEDVDRATAVIAQTAKELADQWTDQVRGDPEVLGVETVDAAARAIVIRVVMKTAPFERWSVSRELRRRILDAFDEAGIEVPPRAVVALPDGAGGGGAAKPR